MYKKSFKNMLSDMKPCQSYESMAENVLLMPMADGNCDMCGRCADACTGKAISINEEWTVDLGKCVFCRDCYDSCEHITPISAPNYAFNRSDFIFTPSKLPSKESPKMPKDIIKSLKHSISIRELDTGSCGACESDINCMGNKYYDMERFGLRMVASPRHADALLVTGPMSYNMVEAAKKTYSAVPEKRLVIACGTCAISGGLFVEGDVVGEGVNDTLPVDMYILGCPPTPNRIIVSLVKAFDLRH